MSDLLVSPGRIDMLLQKFRIRTLLHTRPLKCRNKEVSCTDGVDDDCDGLIDFEDDPPISPIRRGHAGKRGSPNT
jgi:hypothetical protein